MNLHKDLVVIGSGPGGYEVALKAASKGLDVILVEKNVIGGTCLNHGCIPTKTLYKNAEVSQTLIDAEQFGFIDLNYVFDFKIVQKRKNDVINKLRSNIELMLKKAKVEIIYGIASFKDEYTLKVETEDDIKEISADYFIIASGSVEKILPIKGYNQENVLTSKELLDITKVPDKLVIIGGGVIGVEMATIYLAFGSKITIYEYFDRVVPLMDKHISSRLKMYLKKLGIKVVTDALVEEISKTNEELIVSGKTKKGREFSSTTEYVLMATGRKAFIDNLNLDKINIVYDNKGIVVNEYMQTSLEHIYACGDVTGFNMLAHVATFQSLKALDHILDKENNTNFKVIPSCIFTFPEIAVVGLTEEQAKEEYKNIKTNKFMFRANGKALSMGKEDGFVKVVSANNKLIGCHIIGVLASTIIQEAAILIEKQVALKEITEIIHAHPTLSEILLEAIRGLIV